MTDGNSLNADMIQRVVIDTGAMVWQLSPSPTLWRKRLHLDGPSGAGRVTSIVRYDPGSAFPAHDHPDGEEIFVLDGVFSDQTGDYPAGAHILNPEGFRHAPFSHEGCTLFVKLRQYAGADRPHQRRDTGKLEWQKRRGGMIAEMPLYEQDGYDGRTSLIQFEPGARGPKHSHPFGEEVLILEGSLEDEFGTYGVSTWIRNPVGSPHAPFSDGGCIFFLKTGSAQ
jgi:anti-sigma factor ChrR (cupin superfamily)